VEVGVVELRDAAERAGLVDGAPVEVSSRRGCERLPDGGARARRDEEGVDVEQARIAVEEARDRSAQVLGELDAGDEQQAGGRGGAGDAIVIGEREEVEAVRA
jgi:hypothetical protein